MKASFSILLLAVLSSVVSARRATSEGGSDFSIDEWLSHNRASHGNPTQEYTRKLRFGPHETPIEFTEKEVEELIFEKNARFTDVTDFDLESDEFQHGHVSKRQFTTAFPNKVKPLRAVKDRAGMVSVSNMRSVVNELAAIFTRYYTTAGGLEAPTVIFNRAQAIIDASGRSDVSVRRFTNTFAQDSVIARIEGSSRDDSITIAGAHIDSINTDFADQSTARAPGADDDGSGVANLFEAFRVLVQSGYVPRTPIEVQFYAAEEVGLRGSNAIAAAYTTAGTPVKAMLNLDMTAYARPGLNWTMGFVTDRTSASLNRFTKSVAANYASRGGPNGNYPLNITDDYCGYACSDHAPWNAVRIPTVYPYESITENGHPDYHSVSDTVDFPGFSYEHAVQFSETLIGFFIHLTS